jgi:hypothetical protein
MIARALAWLLVIVAAIGASHWATRGTDANREVVVFDATRGCPIVVPFRASAEERGAAELLQRTLARSAGKSPGDFPIVSGAGPRRGIFVGTTDRARGLRPTGAQPPFDARVRFTVDAGAVVLWSEHRAAIERAAAWFLEAKLGVHWFIPGPLGESVPRRPQLTLAPGAETVMPGFLSRDLGSSGGTEGREWYILNKLEARMEHGHALNRIFTRQELARSPVFAPIIDGRKYIPASDGDYNWQPDLTSPAVAQRAAAAANRAFDADHARISFSISENDSIRFDESAATQAAVAPLRYFRHRPDYSDLVFAFSNDVARQVARRHPDQWLGAYAYYWSENAPRFQVAPNLVPWLTADRSQWFEPDFAAGDRALIERWCRSGARLVGVYDYLEGEPYLVPRPVLYGVTGSIPFEYRAGVRAFYGEGTPNWALDGPKLWLAAQLLWAPEQNPAELLDTYYREFWAEAAAPMREFYARCDRAWQEQPRPGYWIKYYQDDDQVRLFPPAVREELRAELAAARRLARTEVVQARVEFVATGFAVTDAFGDYIAARDKASLLAQRADAGMLFAAWRELLRARTRFVTLHGRVTTESPLAIAPHALAAYLRNDPGGRVAVRLSETERGHDLLRSAPTMVQLATGASPDALVRLLPVAANVLDDPQWRKLAVRDVDRTIVFGWTLPGSLWRGSGEPWETRSVTLVPAPDGARSLRFAGCHSEAFSQWAPDAGNGVYVARVHVRAKVSPGNETFLIISQLDVHQQHIGNGHLDRLPPGDWSAGADLCVVTRTPPNGAWVGIGLRVSNQVNDDFAEFSGASLQRLR